MIELVREICERKRGRVHPELASELEIKQALSRRGVQYTAESFSEMLRVLAEDPHIKTIRTINHNAYAYVTETAAESVSTEERDSGKAHTREHPLLSEPAVAQGTQELFGDTPPVRGVRESWEDNTSEGSGSHYANQYWWSEI